MTRNDSDLPEVTLVTESDEKVTLWLGKLEFHLSGEETLEWAEKVEDCATEQHAELLLSQTDKIPTEWRPYHLLFPNYTRGVEGEGLCVLCMHYVMGRWYGFLDTVSFECYSPNDGTRLVRASVSHRTST